MKLPEAEPAPFKINKAAPAYDGVKMIEKRGTSFQNMMF